MPLVRTPSLTDFHAPGWIQRAMTELRVILVRGEVREAHLLANEVVRTLGNSAEARRSSGITDVRLFRKVVGGVLSGIESARMGDLQSATSLLQQLLHAEGPAWLKFVALIWLAQVEARAGDVESAEAVAAEAMDIARDLDPLAQAVTECLFAELEALDGSSQPALDRLTLVNATMERLGSKQGLALSWLTRARILATVELQDECLVAAEQAHAIDPDWVDATIFLARLAVMRQDVAQAGRLLDDLEPPHAPEVRRELQLLRLVNSGLPTWVLSELHQLREAPPGEELIGRLRGLLSFAPEFHPAREVLGWKLFHLQQYRQAEEVFSGLLKQQLDPDLRASATLGMRSARGALQRKVVQEEPTPPPTPVSGNSFMGDLSLLPVPDLLEFLRTTRRSGQVVLVSGEMNGTICLRDGKLIGAASRGYRHLGERLYATGQITAVQLARLTPTEPTSAMGWVDVPTGLVSDDVLRTAFAGQIRCAVREMVGWSEGRFSFQPHTRCLHLGLALALDTQEVLLDVLRQIDEEARIQ